MVLLSHITAESGGLSPRPESGGDLSPCPPPPAQTPMTTTTTHADRVTSDRPVRRVHDSYSGVDGAETEL